MNSLDKKEEDNQEQAVKKPGNWLPVIFCIILFIFLMRFLGIGIRLGIKTSKTEVEQSSSSTPTKTVEQKQKEIEAGKLEEDKKTNLATRYCAKRTQRDRRFYPIPITVTDQNGKTKLQLKNDNIQKGINLTNSDCKNIIDFFYENPLIFKDVESLVEEKYWINMTMPELSFSVGYPDKINKTNYGVGETEQWIYYKDSNRINATYFYIENSRITSYQDF